MRALPLCLALGVFASAPFAHAQYAPAPAPPGVPVNIQADDPGRTYQVTVQDAAGGTHQCVAPCRIQAPPGPSRFIVHGERGFAREALIPPTPATATIQRQRTGLVIGGAVLTSLAAVSVLGGSIAVSQGNLIGATAGVTVGVALLIPGAILLGVGSRPRVSMEPNYGYAHGRLGRPAFQLAGAGVAPTADGAVGALALRF